MVRRNPRHAEPQPGRAGTAYDPSLDRNRLGKPLGRVYQLLLEATATGAWLTVPELVVQLERTYHVRASETGTSARVRDLRKEKHGSHDVPGRKRQGSELWEYRLVLPVPPETQLGLPLGRRP